MELKEMFEPIVHFLKNFQKKEKDSVSKSKAKERLQLVLMQDRASVSPDFFEMMKKEIIEVIKKYIEIDEEQLEVQLTRGFEGEDGTGPALYANIPIKNIKPVAKKQEEKEEDDKPTVDELSPGEAKKIQENIIEDIKEVAEKKQEQVDKADEIEEPQKAENVDKVEEVSEKIAEDSNVDVIEEETSATEEVVEQVATQAANTSFKEKINNIKDGAKETFSKAKNHAKDRMDKIKSKVKAKN